MPIVLQDLQGPVPVSMPSAGRGIKAGKKRNEGNA
jgi:hypothetical protein